MLLIVQNNMAPAGRALCGFYCFILPGKKEREFSFFGILQQSRF